MEGEPRIEEQIISELKSMILQIWESDEGYDLCVDFARKIEKKHPNARNYRLFHTLIGSTPPDDLKEFDFPGDDSVEKFIRSLQ